MFKTCQRSMRTTTCHNVLGTSNTFNQRIPNLFERTLTHIRVHHQTGQHSHSYTVIYVSRCLYGSPIKRPSPKAVTSNIGLKPESHEGQAICTFSELHRGTNKAGQMWMQCSTVRQEVKIEKSSHMANYMSRNWISHYGD